MASPVYILGGSQTDFARNWSRDEASIFEIMKASVEGALESTKITPEQIDVAHVGNFVGELFSNQGHLGGIFAAIDPAFHGLPASRHEAACASGSVAILSAMADIQAGHYDVACVTGVEQMRNVPGKVAAQYLGTAAWSGREAQEAAFLWPWMFDALWKEYDKRYGIKREHLSAIARLNFENARGNANAQTRSWTVSDDNFGSCDENNPVVEGEIRRYDCSQITDGSVSVILASEPAAKDYAQKHGTTLEAIPRITGWGHRTGTMLYNDKIALSSDAPLVFPHVSQCIQDAFKRAGVAGVDDIDSIETHDCFSITEYMAIDHFGITAPGESHIAVEEGWIQRDGKIPMNPGGGLMGGGHPVGATGVRMVLDSFKQVSNQAEGYQVDNARRVATLNIGGSATTCVSFVVEAE